MNLLTNHDEEQSKNRAWGERSEIHGIEFKTSIKIRKTSNWKSRERNWIEILTRNWNLDLNWEIKLELELDLQNLNSNPNLMITIEIGMNYKIEMQLQLKLKWITKEI